MNQRCSTLLLLLLLAALAGLAFAPAPVNAQEQPPVTLTVRAGYDGAYRIGEWFPVFVSISNDGPDLSGTLEWSFPGVSGEQVFNQTIDLPRGSRKRVTLEVFAHDFARNGQVRLLDGATALVTQDISLESADEGVFLAGVVSSDPAMLNSLDSQRITGFTSTKIRHLELADLPEHLATLRGVNALFLHDVDSSALSPAQRETLALWVSLGGQLLVSGGTSGSQATALAAMLPVQLDGTIQQGDITQLAALAGANTPPLTPAAPLSQVQPRAGAEQMPVGSNLLYRWRYGGGLVTFSTFDFSSLRGWPGEGALWNKLLTRLAVLTPGYGARLSQTSLLERGVLRLPSLNLPSTGVVLAFLLAYVLVIGPLNYVVLRRLRRLEWAWLSVPLVVLLFSCGLYAVGTGLRGAQSQLNQAAIVQGVEGQSRAFATAFIGLFSPRRASYTIGLPPGTLVGGAPGRNEQFEPVFADDSGARTMRVLADVVSVTTFVAEQEVNLPVQVESRLTADNTGVSGEVRNTGTSALEDAVLVRGTTFTKLGTLSPGASQQVTASALQQGFPASLGLADSGPFDRQEILRVLFDRDAVRLRNPGMPTAGLNDEQGVYLLGWANQPTTAATIDGREAAQTGLTLYVIRLKS